MSQKYRIDTDHGSYIVETEDPGTSLPWADYWSERNPPPLGLALNGYEFGGGSPRDERNWKKVITDLPERQAAAKQTFESNLPKSDVSRFYDAAKETMFPVVPNPSAEASGVLGIIAPGGPATEGMGLAQALGHSPVANTIRSLASALLPSAERAGEQLDMIRTAATNEAPDLSKAYAAVQRGKELTLAGHGPVSRGMQTLHEAMQPTTLNAMGTPITIDPAAIKYPQSFDMASAAKALAADESSKMTGMMQGQVKQFARALQEANRDVAARLGYGNVFDAAMKEYRQAKTLEAATEIAKKYAIKTAIVAALSGLGGAAGAAGYDLYRAFK